MSISKSNEIETLYVTARAAWRDWLSRNFEKKEEIWLVYPKKVTGKPRIEYNVAVEEALCYGWIDSKVRALDELHTMQRFSIRRPGSKYSQPNKERIRWLLGQEMVHPSIVEELKNAVAEEFQFPKDIMNSIESEPKAWEHYKEFSNAYKRIRIAFIESARRRPEEFRKRLENFLEHTRNGKLIRGFGGIEKYY